MKKSLSAHSQKNTPSIRRLFLQILLGSALSLLSLTCFAFLTDMVVAHQTQSLDVVISHLVYASRMPWLTSSMFGFTFLGEANTLAVIGALIVLYLVLKRYIHEAVLFIVVLAVGGFLNLVLKDIFHRPRPTISPLIHLPSYSYPSGHAMGSMMFFSMLAYLIYKITHKKGIRIVSAFLACLIILIIGFSRIYLGVHYPSDVLGGFIAGFFVFITILLFDRIHILLRLKNRV